MLGCAGSSDQCHRGSGVRTVLSADLGRDEDTEIMPIDLEFLGRQLELILNEQREIRRDIAIIKTRLTAIVDQLEERLGR
jgi:hypothetical protein